MWLTALRNKYKHTRSNNNRCFRIDFPIRNNTSQILLYPAIHSTIYIYIYCIWAHWHIRFHAHDMSKQLYIFFHSITLFILAQYVHASLLLIKSGALMLLQMLTLNGFQDITGNSCGKVNNIWRKCTANRWEDTFIAAPLVAISCRENHINLHYTQGNITDFHPYTAIIQNRYCDCRY